MSFKSVLENFLIDIFFAIVAAYVYLGTAVAFDVTSGMERIIILFLGIFISLCLWGTPIILMKMNFGISWVGLFLVNLLISLQLGNVFVWVFYLQKPFTEFESLGYLF